MLDLKDSPIQPGEPAVVIGGGTSGRAAALLLDKLGARVRLLDKNPRGFSEEFRALAAEKDWELVTGPHEAAHFAGAGLVVPSPGVPVSVFEPLLAQAGDPPWISELELAWLFTRAPVLAITGTSGKTTTSSLAAAMLERSGKKVFLGGNIGTPLSSFVLSGEWADVLVLEVSSFQLMGCRGFHPRVAVLLNISENHLDQHKDMDEYREAKFSLFRNQSAMDVAIFGDGLFEEVMRRKLRARTEFFGVSDAFENTRLLGRHNLLNIEAAWMAAKEFGVKKKTAQEAVRDFAPLPNRLEMLGEWDGVVYINDSKCTTVEALRVALQSLDRPLLLLAGGKFKGGDLQSLAPLLKGRVKSIGLYGASREIFEGAWGGLGIPLSWDETLEQATRRLRGLSAPGDAILLSPATSSFDQYKNYIARGEDFRRIAGELQ